MKLKLITRVLLLIVMLVLLNNQMMAQKAEWDSIASMNTRRWYHAAVELKNGEILVTGGEDITGYLTNSCEIYNSSTNSWRFTDTMIVKRIMHQLFLLDDGRVLAIGGKNEPSCEIYDPTKEKWTLTDSLLLTRKEQPKAVKLQNGNILITGGHRDTGVGKEEIYKSCEIFNTQSEKWIKVADMNYTRKGHTITVLTNGKILVTGGIGRRDSLDTMTEICEIYDISANTWVLGDTIKSSHYNHDALLLKDGRIFISAGWTKGKNIIIQICEIYDPVMDKWNYMGALNMDHSSHSSFQLNDSTILITGGDSEYWEIFNLNKQQSTNAGHSDITWVLQSVLELTNNNIIKIGGLIWQDAVVFPTNKCELFHFNVTGIKDKGNERIVNYKLNQNYPNPFNPTTKISYTLETSSHVILKIYNTHGQEIETLVNGVQNKGDHSIDFNAKDLSSGLYFYRLNVTGSNHPGKQFTDTKKMLLVR